MLATCDEHGLEYVTDETNFQPDITLRNAIRNVLAGNDIPGVRIFLKTIPFPILTETRACVAIKRYRR